MIITAPGLCLILIVTFLVPKALASSYYASRYYENNVGKSVDLQRDNVLTLSEGPRMSHNEDTDSKDFSVPSRIVVATSARNPSEIDKSKAALSQDSKDSRRKRPEQERCRIFRGGFGEGLCDATSVGTKHGIPMCDTHLHLERYKQLKQEKEKKPHLKRP